MKNPPGPAQEVRGLTREREVGDFTEEELRERFRKLDVTGSGRIEKHEWLRFSLRHGARVRKRSCELQHLEGGRCLRPGTHGVDEVVCGLRLRPGDIVETVPQPLPRKSARRRVRHQVQDRRLLRERTERLDCAL